MALTTGFDSFSVYPLSHFKGVEVEEGQQLCRKIEKGGKESKGVIIPQKSQEEFLAAMDNDSIMNEMYSHYLNLVESAVKAKIEQGATTIIPEDYSNEVIAEMLKAQEIAEGRISKQRIEAWFNGEVQTVLYKAFAQNLGDALTNEKAQLLLGNYKAAFGLFAKREVEVSDAVWNNLDKALQILPDSPIKSYCVGKLPSMKQKTVESWGL